MLAIRFYLRVTDYPRIESGSLHVAHMLWGGLLMLAALVLLLSYIGKGTHQLSALLGGFGFGAFIDELGKFITRDNDYFYKPAIALIYVVFILLYLTFRSIHREQLATPEEFLANALQELEPAAVRKLTRDERNRILNYLSRSDPGHPLTITLKEVMLNVPIGADRPRPLQPFRERLLRFYRQLAVSRGFHTAVVTFFVAQLGLKMAFGLAQLFGEGIDRGVFYMPVISAIDRGLAGRSPSDWAGITSSVLSGVFVVLGVILIRRSRLAAFRMFQRSILISIFLTQVFMFYREQWSALIGLTFNVLVFLALRFMIEREKTRPGRTAAGRDSAAASL
ncbi:MAG TPA: hypothetical protein VK943_09960 [Arenibaculum sp.]|nr:hypothetical protein [Arenibaculum sp.]